MLHRDDCYVLHVHMRLVSPSALCQSRHGEIPDSSLQSTGSSRSSHSRSPSLHHMHEEDKPVPRRSHSHGYPHGHGHRGRLRSVGFALISVQPHMLILVITQLNEFLGRFVNEQLSFFLFLVHVWHFPVLAAIHFKSRICDWPCDYTSALILKHPVCRT